MLFYEFLRVGWTVLAMHKFRSALTLISIAIGTFSIVLMSSLATSGTTTMTRGLEDVGGARMVIVFPKEPERAEKKRASYSRGLTIDDAQALSGRIPNLHALGIMTELGDREVRHGGKMGLRADYVGGSEDFLASFGMKLAAGRNIDRQDLDGARRVVVVGHGVVSKMFPDPQAAIGQLLRVGNDSLRVIGVLAEVKRFGVRFGFDWNDFVLVPITMFGRKTNGAVIMVTTGAEHNDLAKRIAVAILRDRHHGVDDFQAFDFATLMEKLGAVFSIMHLIAGLIAGIALLAGGIGVMNILLVSVSERVREIGVRKALGAPDRAIALQFLFESALLSSLGGLLGALLGCAGALLSGPIIRMHADAWVAVISVGAVVAALVASLIIGIFFGLVPARKASKLLVVDCLRSGG
jgi:putative ABC transport system permease protein